MPITVSCAECGASFRVADEHAGKRAKCKECGVVLTIPEDEAPAPAPAPDESVPSIERPRRTGGSRSGSRTGSRRRGAEAEPEPDAMPPAAIGAAIGAAVVSAAAWYFVGKATDREIGWLAIGVGSLVGFAMKQLGGRGVVAAVSAAVLSIVAILGGKFVLYSAFASEFENELIAGQRSQIRAIFEADRALGRAASAHGGEPSLEDVRGFYDEVHGGADALTTEELTDLREQLPDLIALDEKGSFERYRSDIEAEMRAAFDAEASPFDLMKENFEIIDLLFFVLGASAAFGLVSKAD